MKNWIYIVVGAIPIGTACSLGFHYHDAWIGIISFNLLEFFFLLALLVCKAIEKNTDEVIEVQKVNYELAISLCRTIMEYYEDEDDDDSENVTTSYYTI